jgi:hypothetical protein
MEVPEASSPPLGLNARLDRSPVDGASGEPGAGVNAGELARAAMGARRKSATMARHRPHFKRCCSRVWAFISASFPLGARSNTKAGQVTATV